MDTILDLHGTRHSDVFRKIDNFLYEHIEKGSKGVSIITGNSKTMKMMVSEIADEYKLQHQTNLLNNGQIDLLLT
jgi:DNA-nicking Smr family endonuclease